VPVAAFEGVEQVVFDLGCDVAIDLDQAIRQVMPESAGLGYLGDVVGDEPCLMAVTESVEG
jgi:ribosomal protein L21E